MRSMKITEDTKFTVLPAGNGIHLIEVRQFGMTLKVTRVLSYEPVAFGKQNPGAAQMGVYELKSEDGTTFYAIIRDYRAYEGDWRVVLEGEIAGSIDDLKSQAFPN
jgi:hypothetical protein